jgi:hypothetical protein
MYLAAIGMRLTSSGSPKVAYLPTVVVTVLGVMLLYQTSQPSSLISRPTAGIPSFSISVALNLILTLMIVVRLILHGRNLRNALGGSDTASGLYKAIIAVLVESSALNAISFILYIGPWAHGGPAQFIFSPILAEAQVRVVLHSPGARAVTPGSGLIVMMNRSSLHSSSSFG